MKRYIMFPHPNQGGNNDKKKYSEKRYQERNEKLQKNKKNS